jgi:hypothetical protein
MRALFIATAVALCLTSGMASAGCKENFSVLGLPLLSQIEYRTHATLPGVSAKTAAKRIAQTLRAEGYSAVKISGGTVTALQETSGSGRPQSLRFITKTTDKGLRIEAIFTIQQGQIAGERVVRNELCRLIATAG